MASMNPTFACSSSTSKVNSSTTLEPLRPFSTRVAVLPTCWS